MRPKEMREKWAKLLSDAKAVADKAEAESRDLTTDEKSTIEAAVREATDLRDGPGGFRTLEALETGHAEATAPAEPRAGRPGFDGAEPTPRVDRRTIGQQFIESEEWTTFKRSVAPNGFSEKTNVGASPAVSYKRLLPPTQAEMRALLTGASDTLAGAFVFNDVQAGYTPQGLQRPLTIRDVITNGNTDSDTVEYVRMTGQTNAAAPVAEATATSGASGTKPESTLAFAKVTTAVKTIAHWIPATKRALSDAGQLRTIIDSFLRYGLEEEVEDQIIAGDGTGENFEGIGTVSGVQAQAFDTDLFTTTRKARTKVRTVGRRTPTAYLINPADWETIDLLQDNEARYYGSGPFALSPARLWGLPVVESEAVPAGTGYVGDFRLAVIWDREAASIQVSDSHSDFFIRNMVAILAEMRAAFGVLQPNAFVEIDLTP
jgi:HK97 family phage major capsid protein